MSRLVPSSVEGLDDSPEHQREPARETRRNDGKGALKTLSASLRNLVNEGVSSLCQGDGSLAFVVNALGTANQSRAPVWR